jgi:hypothetical protein
MIRKLLVSLFLIIQPIAANAEEWSRFQLYYGPDFYSPLARTIDEAKMLEQSYKRGLPESDCILVNTMRKNLARVEEDVLKAKAGGTFMLDTGSSFKDIKPTDEDIRWLEDQFNTYTRAEARYRQKFGC